MFGLSTDVKVESDGNPMRHVTAEYDGSGYNPTSMTKMTQYLDKNTTATIEFKYDTLGNIIEKGTPYVTKMEYSIDDDKLKTTVTDAEGMVADAYTDGTEHTLKTVKKHENGGDPATTEFDDLTYRKL